MGDDDAEPFLRGFGRGLAEGLIETEKECPTEWGEGLHGLCVRLSAHACKLPKGHEAPHVCYCGSVEQLDAGEDRH